MSTTHSSTDVTPQPANAEAAPASDARLRTALSGSFADFARPTGPDILARTQVYYEWYRARREADVWSYTRTLEGHPHPVCVIRNEAGTAVEGLDFASQDYLALASHPAVAEAARRALRDFGPHSAGSAVLVGNTTLSARLEEALGEMLQMPHVLLFPTGWGAGFGTMVGLVRPDDYIVMDNLAHACLQQGAYAASRRVTRFPHLDNGGVGRILADIRSRDARNGILVVTEGLFSMDSDTPDIPGLQRVCREYGATLMVDVAHDFGALGPGGTGHVGLQGALGDVDLVMGAFSKTFASNGGFLATRSPAVRQFVKAYGGPHIFSNALSPLQAAIVLEAVRIVRSTEGDELRARLMSAVGALRDGLAGRGVQTVGEPSAIVPALVGGEGVMRLAGRLIFERRVFANPVEYPAVAVGAARFRMQVMAAHTEAQAHEAATIVADAIAEASEILRVTRA